MYYFKCHKKAYLGFNCEKLTNSNVIYMSFDTWKTLYYADPDNWFFYKDDGPLYPYWLPAYQIPKPYEYEYIKFSDWSYRYIKFLTARDYQKFIRFAKKIFKNGEDTKNTKELIELTEIIHKRVEERLRKAQEKTSEAIQEIEKETEKCKKNKLSF